MNIAVVGCGYWGINYVRTFSEHAGSKIVLVCDAVDSRLRVVRERYPLVATTNSLEETLANRWVDAVVVATPASTHFEIAKQCLLRGKHVLVEKPVTKLAQEAEALTQIAREQKRVLMVGHTFLFNSGVRKMKELMVEETFGKTYYLHATRTNMGPIRDDVNAMWDLGAHDISIFNYLLGRSPERVSAIAAKSLGKQQDDVVFATLTYDGGIIANIHVSWLDPNKVREVVAVGSRQRIVFDDLNNSERVRIYEKGVSSGQQQAESFGEFRLLVRDGDIISPRVEPSEPLRNLAQEFIDCVTNDRDPLSGGPSGVAVVKTLQAIDRSLAADGASVGVT